MKKENKVVITKENTKTEQKQNIVMDNNAYSSSYRSIKRIFLSSPIKKSYTVLGITLVSIFLILLLVVRPTLNTISERRKQIKVLEANKQFLQERFEVLTGLNISFIKNKTKYQKAIKYYSSDKDTLWLVNEIMDLSDDYGMKFQSVTFNYSDDSIEQTNLLKGKVTVILTGSDISSFWGLAKRIENLPTYSSISNASIALNEDKEDGISGYTFTYSFFVYFLNSSKLEDFFNEN